VRVFHLPSPRHPRPLLPTHVVAYSSHDFCSHKRNSGKLRHSAARAESAIALCGKPTTVTTTHVFFSPARTTLPQHSSSSSPPPSIPIPPLSSSTLLSCRGSSAYLPRAHSSPLGLSAINRLRLKGEWAADLQQSLVPSRELPREPGKPPPQPTSAAREKLIVTGHLFSILHRRHTSHPNPPLLLYSSLICGHLNSHSSVELPPTRIDSLLQCPTPHTDPPAKLLSDVSQTALLVCKASRS